MIEIDTFCTFYGDDFYPSELEKSLNIIFDEKNNPNEFLQETKIKVEYGTATLKYNNSDYPNFDYLDTILNIKNNSRFFCITDIVLHMNVEHNGQCNFEFTPELLKRIEALGIGLSITTYQSDSAQF